MRVLFDQGTPDPLRQSLLGHEVATAYERGWSSLKNGELLDVAEREPRKPRLEEAVDAHAGFVGGDGDGLDGTWHRRGHVG